MLLADIGFEVIASYQRDKIFPKVKIFRPVARHGQICGVEEVRSDIRGTLLLQVKFPKNVTDDEIQFGPCETCKKKRCDPC